MYGQVLLVISVLLSVALSNPLYESTIIEGQNKQQDLPPTPDQQNEIETTPDLPQEGNPLDFKLPATEFHASPPAEDKQPDDLIGQETYYPIGGVWWGFRPWGGWGGWGGYRPWHGWHGWHGWHRPHWGGHWGGNWGGHWGGRPWGGSGWGRTTS